ncbi:MAG: HTH domain-containing protein [Promethearchaeota archaeon]|nr:MAG: HTH domain-containing protein [Candidatus Lokiarchaeota archaeon]
MAEIIASNEQTVLEIINEYLDKNRFFSVYDILPFISSRFAKSGINININGIRTILKSLVEKNFIVEGSKLTRNEILSNFNRKKIYEYIQKNPGAHFYNIVSNLDLNIPVVEWHLNILIKFMYISKEKIENRGAYFDVNVKSEDRMIIYLISKDKCKQIIDFLKENQEGITRSQISEQLNMHSTTVTKYTDKLHENRILTKKSLPNKTLYFLNNENYEKLSQNFNF